jgi:PAS domain S-box-containing protein
LLAAFIVPMTLAVLALFVHAYARERAGVERAALDVSRALMQAVDRELISARAGLEALATSPSLDNGDLRAFHDQAIAVLGARPGNILVLTDSAFRQRDNTAVAFGSPLPQHGNPGAMRRVFGEARPGVSDLYLGPAVGRLLTSVDVPVVRDGRVRWALSMQYLGERLGAILERQQLPPDAGATIYDGNARVIWRSGPGPYAGRAGVGHMASSPLAAGMALGPEGIVDEANEPNEAKEGGGQGEGGRVTVYSRSSISNWTVAIALQRGALDANLWHSLRWIVLGTLLLLLLGALLVRLVGKQIERALRALVHPAVALGHGEQVVLPPLMLDEADDVGHALVQTATLLRERTVQRDQAERAKQALREAKRAAEHAEAFLRGIFEETPDAILLVGADCRIERVNVQAERMFGWAPRSLPGRPLDELLLDSASSGSVCTRMRSAREHTSMAGSTTLRGRRRDGSLFPADAMAKLLPDRVLLIVTVRDVSAAWEQEQALRHALDDKSTLLKELSHRVKNNLQLIISLFNLQARALAEPQARQALLEAANRVRAMALVHERLVQSRALAAIPIRDYVAGLCDQLASAASASARGIALRLEVEPLDFGLDIAVPLGLVLNELVSNSLKHGYPDGRRGVITVRLARDAGAGRAADAVDSATAPMMCLSVSDDGIGLPPDTDKTFPHTFGLKLVGALSDQLHATMTLARDAGAGGTCATLLFRAPGVVAAAGVIPAPNQEPS